MNYTITYNPKADAGYQWVLRAQDDVSVTRICFGSQQEAERYVILCNLYNEPL